MAGWQPVLVCNDVFEVSARPKSWWRRWWLRHIPFFVGDQLTFCVGVRVLRANEDNHLSWWFQSAETRLLGPSSQLVDRRQFAGPDQFQRAVKTSMVPVSGEWQMLFEQAPGHIAEKAAYSFTAVTKERFLGWLLLVVIGLPGLAVTVWRIAAALS